MPRHPGPVMFCEACGRSRTVSRAAADAGRLPTGFAWCERCGTLTCETCRIEDRGCSACLPEAPALAALAAATPAGGIPAQAPRVRRAAVGSLVASLGLVAVLAVVASQPSAGTPTGAVLGNRAAADRTPGAAGPTSPALATPAASPSPVVARLTVLGDRVRAWRDVLGAWHAQAIAHVRNDTGAPVALAPDQGTVRVTDGGTVVHTGEWDGAAPAVLGPGAEGYLFAGFALSSDLRAPAVDAQAVAVRADDLVPLDVVAAAVTPEPGRLVVAGRAENAGATKVRDATVAAVALDRDGAPLAGFVDRASLGLLGPGQTREFRAAEPVAPPIDPDTVADLVVAAWGRPAGD